MFTKTIHRFLDQIDNFRRWFHITTQVHERMLKRVPIRHKTRNY